MPGFKQLHKEKKANVAVTNHETRTYKIIVSFFLMFVFGLCLSLLGHFIVPFLRK